jgi:hypothetical protein
MVIEMPTTPDNSNIIKDPFKTIYDVTDQTPVDEIPEEYYKQTKQRFQDAKTLAEQLQTGLEEFSKSTDVEELLMIQAHTTISKYDDHIIRAVFHVGLSTYFKPLNLALKADSGSGKSYSTLETIKFLPDEDIQIIGSQSPKVISHETGIKKTKDGKIIDEKNEPEKPQRKDYGDISEYKNAMDIYKIQKEEWEKDIKDCIYEVDLRNKVLLFLESVNQETFRMFKTTMSHDNDFIDHKYVDDRGKVHVTRLVGAPAIIFNSVDNNYVEEQATRNLTATPSTRNEKIEDSMEISNNRSAYPWIYEQEVFHRKIIKEYIRKIKKTMAEGKIRVATPFIGIKEGFSKDAVRDMRDFNKFLELLPSYAIFKLFQRPIFMIQGKRYLIPTIQDALDAKAAFDSIIETTKTSTDFRVLEFYHTIVSKRVNGCDAEFLTDEYNKGKKRAISVKRVREWLTRLEEVGYVDIREAAHENDKGYIDRRYNNYIPLKIKNAPNTPILDTAVDLRFILEKGFEKWLENTPLQTDTPIIILNFDGTANQITLEDMKNIIINNKKTDSIINGVYSTPVSNSISQIEVESVPKSETAVKGVFSKYITATPIQRQPGVYCSALDHGNDCHYEAEWNLNGNLFCSAHFKEQVKMCEDNGTGVNMKNPLEKS